MSNLLEQGASWLNDQRHKFMTSTIVYERGVDSVTLLATIGRTEFEQSDEQGLISRIESRDFVMQRADLVLGGNPVLPKAGDIIKETVGTTTYVYEVMAPGGEPPFRYADPYRYSLRVHTKYIETK